MSDERMTSNEGLNEGEASAGAIPPPVRDIIAERMAQRMQKADSAPAQELSFPEPHRSEMPDVSEPISSAPTEATPEIESQVEVETAPSPLILTLAKTTESLETTPPTSEPRERRNGRDRGRNRDRDDKRPAREPRTEIAADATTTAQPQTQQPRPRQERPARPERSERNVRPERTERPERKDQAERPTREAKPTVPKTSENAFSRARSLASKLGVSIVIPLYNEEDSLRELTAALREELFRLCDNNYEIIYINDGSTDRSADILRDIVAGTSKVSTLTFRSNRGKSDGLSVGFKEARYGIVVTMDADLQDDPKELVNLIAKLDEGFDLVSGWKKKRNDPISKTAPSKLFNAVTSTFSGIKLHDFNCGLKAYRKQVTDALDVYGELHRYLPALAHWQGFRVTEIPVLHHPRRFGKSKFGSSRFFKGFLDLLTIVFTNRYGKRPLHLFGTIGMVLTMIGLGINVYVSFEWAKGIPLSNRPILLLGILLMMVGVQLISIGLLGEMIVKNAAKTHDVPFIKDKRKPRPPRPGEDRPERRRGNPPNRP
ncbi:MAG: glycosyltransferase [bacterium]